MYMRRNIQSLVRTGLEHRPKVSRGFGYITKVNYELCDLEACDPLLPPYADPSSALEVVPVHNDMNHKVQSDRDP